MTPLRFKHGERVRIRSPMYPEYRYGVIKRFPISGKVQKRLSRRHFSAYLGTSGKALSIWARRKGMPKGWHTTLLVPVEQVSKIRRKGRLQIKRQLQRRGLI